MMLDPVLLRDLFTTAVDIRGFLQHAYGREDFPCREGFPQDGAPGRWNKLHNRVKTCLYR